MVDFFMSARNVTGVKTNPQFGSEPDVSRYLLVPDTDIPAPVAGQLSSRADWAKAIIKAASDKAVPDGNDQRVGHILFFVHGYKNSPDSVIRRHRLLQAGLNHENFPGVVASFDWPSGDLTLGYLEDRHDAKNTAFQLVKDGVKLMIDNQQPDCWINVHILAHSMGAFVLREAFDDADDHGGNIGLANWSVSQIALIGGDLSSGNFEGDNSKTRALFNHCRRLTNYSNKHDSALLVSNIKRAGFAPRVGRVGLPDQSSGKAVNVDCSKYWSDVNDGGGFTDVEGEKSHSWHFGDPTFIADFAEVLKGNDREIIRRRQKLRDGRFTLT